MLLGGASFAAWAYLPKFARAADGRDPRLVVVILRGALDGLATVAPIGDPDYAGLHGSIALRSSGPNAALMLNLFFALHPAMPEFARMYREKKAAVVHAVATSYRERSHFDGQDVLESGFAGPGRVQSGWLNRALESVTEGRTRHERARGRPDHAFDIAGAAPTVGWTRWRCRRPPRTPRCARRTCRHRDPALAKALTQGLALDKTAQGDDMKPKPGTNGVAAMRLVARGAAKLMAADDGPRIGALAFDGWDTHANEGGAGRPSGAAVVRARRRAGGIRERARATLARHGRGRRHRIRPHRAHQRHRRHRPWHRHRGTARRRRGERRRVISDWPGLKTANLYQARDLAPTTDLRAIMKGVLQDQSRPSRARAGGECFRICGGEADEGTGGVGPQPGAAGRGSPLHEHMHARRPARIDLAVISLDKDVVEVPEPGQQATKVACASCAAVIGVMVWAATIVPLTTKCPLLAACAGVVEIIGERDRRRCHCRGTGWRPGASATRWRTGWRPRA